MRFSAISVTLATIFALSAISTLVGCQQPAEPVPIPAPGKPLSADPAAPDTGVLEYFDGVDTVRGPYEVHEGRIIVEEDIDLGPASSLRLKSGSVVLSKAGAGSARIAGNVYVAAKIGGSAHWENGVIPYGIDLDEERRAVVEEAIAKWNTAAPVIFVPKRSGETKYALFKSTSKDFSSSPIGMSPGDHHIRIKVGAKLSSVLHEMGHTAGLYHEHQRRDRNSHVSVTATKEELENHGDFRMGGEAHGDFDYNSLMIYGVRQVGYHQDENGDWKRGEEGATDWVWMDSLPGHPVPDRSSFLTEGDLAALRYLYMGDRGYWQDTKESITPTGSTTIMRPFRNRYSTWLLQYKQSTGMARTYEALYPSGNIFLQCEQSIGRRWTEIEYFRRYYTTYVFLYDSETGEAKVRTLDNDGCFDEYKQQVTLPKGLDIIRFFTPEGMQTPYVLLYNKHSSGGTIYPVGLNGVIDLDHPVEEIPYEGWDDVAVLEDVDCKWDKPGRNGIVTRTFLVWYNRDNGFTKIEETNTDGTLGGFKVSALGAGWSTMQGYGEDGRGVIWFRNNVTGLMRFYDSRPTYSGSTATLDYPGFWKVREFDTTDDYLMATSQHSNLSRKKFWIFKKSTTELYNYDAYPF